MAAAFAEDYYLTYRFQSINAEIGERAYIVKAMTKTNGEPVYTLQLATEQKNQAEFIEQNRDAIIDFALAYEADLRSNSHVLHSTMYKEKTTLDIHPIRIRIELNEGFAIISVIK